MTPSGDGAGPVQAKVFLVDPATMKVAWMNESASKGLAELGVDATSADVDRVVPMAGSLGVSDAARFVADTGVAQHLQADVVSTARGSMTLVVSIYRLPDGMLLLVADHTWLSGTKRPDADDQTPGRKRRGR